ncbi:MAG: hypothetical protein J1F66_02260 [Clostridiales bacterium]|nr:hypothetical protein [Clostridiales bacterium]
MITNYLYKNLCWEFNKNPFENLLAEPTTERQFYDQLEKLANSYFPERKHVEILNVEFCLNKIALSKGKTAEEKLALSYFPQYWSNFVRLKNLFGKKYMTFPSNANGTRLELIAELIAKCSQFATTSTTLARMCMRAAEICDLSEREERYLHDAMELYKTKYYCSATLAILQKKQHGVRKLAKFLQPRLLKQDYTDNTKYWQAAYRTNKIDAVIDCMGQSATRLKNIPTHIDTKIFVYANGRNVFDTFCASRFGNNVAEFASETRTVAVAMQYFVEKQREVRKVTLTNKGKCARTFTVEIPVKYIGDEHKATYIKMENTLCLAIAGDNFFCGTTIVHDGEIVDATEDSTLCHSVKLDKNTTYTFDLVTEYAFDTPTLADAVEDLQRFGNTRAPYLIDSASDNVTQSKIELKLTPSGYVMKRPNKKLSKQLNYSYQLGDNDIATFIDNGGNSTTLIKGFAFGIGGESIYAITNGAMSKINGDNFHIDVDRLCYSRGNATCAIYHNKEKCYDIEYKKPCKTLFYFPLEYKSKVVYSDGVFTVEDKRRRYTITCFGEIESYTTNALECSEEKPRYKLSGNLDEGSCLAICFATGPEVKVRISPTVATPMSTPIIRESLVSTYLNYVNDKNVFCLSNYLKRPDCLTVAAICYTNPTFVRKYLDETFEKLPQKNSLYYDVTGKLKNFEDKLTFPLAVIYYLNLVGELPEEMKKTANGVLFSESFANQELCVKALALKRAATLNGFDRVRCLIEYNNLKKLICAQPKLYAYAQAIGALPLANPSKQRLKDLCNQYDVPKSWYYVSQLENLYGLTISAGKLHIAPKVTAENVLEQFALNIGGKRIDTTFAKAAVQSMTLNGTQCFQPFYPQNLKNTENELVVRY